MGYLVSGPVGTGKTFLITCFSRLLQVAKAGLECCIGRIKAVAQDVEIVMPLKGIIDFAEEERRLKKEINKLEKDLATVTKKLSNEDFLRKAPHDIIEKEKGKAQDVNEKREKLLTSLNRIHTLISE